MSFIVMLGSLSMNEVTRLYRNMSTTACQACRIQATGYGSWENGATSVGRWCRLLEQTAASSRAVPEQQVPCVSLRSCWHCALYASSLARHSWPPNILPHRGHGSQKSPLDLAYRS